MEEFYKQPGERQEMVFNFMGIAGIENIEIAYFLLKEASWNLENAVNSFYGEVGGEAPQMPAPPLIQQQSSGSHEQEEQPTMEQRKSAFNEMFPEVRLTQQVSDLRYQRGKKWSGKVDEEKLTKFIDRLSLNKQYGERLMKSNRDIKNNKAFIMFLNEHFNTKIRFSFGSFTSNLALSYLKKKPLLVYVHNDKRMVNGVLAAILQDPAITEYINQNFVVYGMFDNSNDYSIINNDIPISGLPGVACYCYSEKENSHVFLGGHKLIGSVPAQIIDFLGGIVAKFRSKYPLQKKEQTEEKPVQKKPEKIQNLFNTNTIIQEQNELYRKMEQQYKMKREVSRLNKQQKEKKKTIIEQCKTQFEKEPQGGNILQVVFRLPSGEALKRRFQKNDKVQILYTYVECFGSQKFENQYGDFDLIQTYPPLNLSEKKKQHISEVFPDSDHENLIVRDFENVDFIHYSSMEILH